jgi:hypothetical protein
MIFVVFVLVCNLGNILRRFVLPKSVKKMSLRTLCEKLIKIGTKVIDHSRYVIFQVAEVAVPRALFSEILNRVQQL